MKERKTFWDKNAGRYDRFMRKDRAAYEEMYKLIRPVVKAKTVLELATGTGLIAKHIVNAAAHIEATDASAEMIAEAKRDNRSAKLHGKVQLCRLIVPLCFKDHLRGGVRRLDVRRRVYDVFCDQSRAGYVPPALCEPVL